MKLFNLICVPKSEIRVLKCSSFEDHHGPEKVLDFKSHTFYLSKSRDFAELRYDFKQFEAINEIWIMLGMHDLDPHYVTISVVTDKVNKKYLTLVEDYDFPIIGSKWHKFKFPTQVAKYYKVLYRRSLLIVTL